MKPMLNPAPAAGGVDIDRLRLLDAMDVAIFVRLGGEGRFAGTKDDRRRGGLGEGEGACGGVVGGGGSGVVGGGGGSGVPATAQL